MSISFSFCTKFVAHAKQKLSIVCRTSTACIWFLRNPNIILGIGIWFDVMSDFVSKHEIYFCYVQMMYSTFDAGNYFVIPGSPAEMLETYNFLALNRGHDARIGMAYASNDFVVAITGSQFSYNGSWLEHTIVLKALAPLIADFCPDSSSTCHLKVGIVSGNSSSSYKVALEVRAWALAYSIFLMKCYKALLFLWSINTSQLWMHSFVGHCS